MRRLILGICVVLWVCCGIVGGVVYKLGWLFQNKLALWIGMAALLVTITIWAYNLGSESSKSTAADPVRDTVGPDVDKAKQSAMKVDMFKAARLLHNLTDDSGGVVSHQRSGHPLPGPSAQAFLALLKLAYVFPDRDFLPSGDAEKRLTWLSQVRSWCDWEGHQFNCLAASYGLRALAAGYTAASASLRPRLRAAVNRTAKELISNFNDDAGGWSWCRQALPTYPYYTASAVRALLDAMPYVQRKNQEAAQAAIGRAETSLKRYLRERTGDHANSAMAIAALVAVCGRASLLDYGDYLPSIVAGIASHQRCVLHTEPTFYIELTSAEIVRALVEAAPTSSHTLEAAGLFADWARENQGEGWSWFQVPGEASWATAQVLLTFAAILETPELVGGLV